MLTPDLKVFIFIIDNNDAHYNNIVNGNFVGNVWEKQIIRSK